MDVQSTTRTIVETTHVVTLDKADQGALFAVAARNKLGAAPDAPATLARADDGSISVTIVMTADSPDEASEEKATPKPDAPPAPQVATLTI